MARRAPLILFVDDLQWADLGSISLLFHLGRHLAGSRILIVGAFRPEEIALGRDGERHPLEQVVNELLSVCRASMNSTSTRLKVARLSTRFSDGHTKPAQSPIPRDAVAANPRPPIVHD